MRYVVVMFDAGGWHAVWVGDSWDAAVTAHGGAVNALRVIDHPHAEEVKIIPNGADYSEPGLASELGGKTCSTS